MVSLYVEKDEVSYRVRLEEADNANAWRVVNLSYATTSCVNCGLRCMPIYDTQYEPHFENFGLRGYLIGLNLNVYMCVTCFCVFNKGKRKRPALDWRRFCKRYPLHTVRIIGQNMVDKIAEYLYQPPIRAYTSPCRVCAIGWSFLLHDASYPCQALGKDKFTSVGYILEEIKRQLEEKERRKRTKLE